MQENILDFIEKIGKSDSQICSILNWNRNKITDIKRGKSKFTIEDIERLSENFHTSADYILSKKNNETTFNNSVNNNKHSTITIQNGSTHTRELTEIENELLTICSSLDTRSKNKLLSLAYELQNNKQEN
ncbi:MAG: helix-turn-helix domain-containing protein [Clostridia bacterium]